MPVSRDAQLPSARRAPAVSPSPSALLVLLLLLAIGGPAAVAAGLITG